MTKTEFIATFLLAFALATGLKAQNTEQDNGIEKQPIQHTEQADSLSESLLMQSIPEVMVKGERPVARLERGKLTYNMPLLLERMPADNAFDALRNIPGVSVDDEKVNFAGHTVTLIINGKATTMSQQEITERLKMMPASQLAKAEVMLAAPASYHVRGAAINIETRSFTKQATTAGQLQGAWKQSKNGAGVAGANLLHSTGRLMLDASYRYSNGKGYGEAEHTARHPLGNSHVPYHDLTTNSARDISHNYRLGADYRFAEKHLLSLAYSGSWSANHSLNTTTGDSRSSQKSDGHMLLHNIDADYSLPFGLRLSASYLRYENNRDQNLNGTIFDTSRNLLSDSKQKIDKWLVAADQWHDFGGGWGLSYGAKAQFTRNNSSQTTITPGGDPLPESTSSVDIDERIANGYVGFSKQITPTLGIEASLTVENFHNSRWDEWRIYPSFNMLWQAGKKSLFNLSFTSDAVYPSYWSTMSNIHYSSVYSEIHGNPYLKPSEIYDISLMWQWQRRYTLVAFATLKPDNFVQLPYQPSDRMAVIMKEVNFDHRNSFGLQASAQYRAGQWLNGNAMLTAIYSEDKCDDFFDIPFDRSKVVWIASTTASALISPKANLRLMLNPFFQSDAIQGVYDISGMFSLTASLRWASGNGRWNVSLDGRNLTNRRYETVSRWRNQDFGMSVCQDWRTVSLTATYKFGDYKEKKRKVVDTSRMGY